MALHMWPFTKSGFSGIPGPSPWYLSGGEFDVGGFKWKPLGKHEPRAGKTGLYGVDGPILIVDFQHYVMPLDGSRILVWYQDFWGEIDRPTPPVELFVFDAARLTPIVNVDRICAAMTPEKRRIASNEGPVERAQLPTTIVREAVTVSFPAAAERLDELLMLCHSSAIPIKEKGSADNLALMVARPKESTITLYPQDWWNGDSKLDRGYQWVTRVRRDDKTKRVFGEGIRIGAFELDESLCRLAR
jgi:hypothetical protein